MRLQLPSAPTCPCLTRQYPEGQVDLPLWDSVDLQRPGEGVFPTDVPSGKREFCQFCG
ncbi:hypothetical protein DACRYDRAFT_22643 [Dacryopinax primogenitus]|uniref:Uncharacterized protein n=1 Tax=Dacryopinax primogenitus (strain DJM 731) TaxID=1858805 RepID=M5FUV1_DACPD|nr:uncharacterized protein DACRYDRAFT_22643 [Dacryopinax primogenitus]EJU01546.1 hypothetical protein DACRYDRAFT_22643 [Dacryopinax primogenitus]